MPRTKRTEAPKRINIRILQSLMMEVDKILEEITTYPSRQQFIEAAIREKIEKVLLIREKLKGVPQREAAQNP